MKQLVIYERETLLYIDIFIFLYLSYSRYIYFNKLDFVPFLGLFFHSCDSKFISFTF